MNKKTEELVKKANELFDIVRELRNTYDRMPMSSDRESVAVRWRQADRDWAMAWQNANKALLRDAGLKG